MFSHACVFDVLFQPRRLDSPTSGVLPLILGEDGSQVAQCFQVGLGALLRLCLPLELAIPWRQLNTPKKSNSCRVSCAFLHLSQARAFLRCSDGNV